MRPIQTSALLWSRNLGGLLTWRGLPLDCLGIPQLPIDPGIQYTIALELTLQVGPYWLCSQLHSLADRVVGEIPH